ncbi:MAG: xanthine dehydrogenase family protein molybdopterin-binding subunit [Burkholderiaceae bacterium]|nr:MAG: xanthine dehydrogenase family protein molybdopterin-binding subunit [Burkholderiaceae bacterium]TAM05899.1 MAG: xanthine dehydrogenase family protein molybdopterin-binding subunit [Pusillimonas sp.]
MGATVNKDTWIGRPFVRKEDEALLTGQARFIDDLEPVTGLRHAAILRSPHPHARIRGIDTSRAEAMPGVYGVVTGRQLAELVGPIPNVVETPARYLPFAIDKVRYVGEPVAVVVADDRYLAEDALELISVDYEPLEPAADIEAAMAPGASLLHEQAGSNVLSTRVFRYGDPDRAFKDAADVIEFSYHYPRSITTPMETYGVIANFESAPDRYTIWANFQGPYILQPLMARSLGVHGNRLRILTPPASGGSFGVKQSVYAYMLLLAGVSRKLGVPVKWIEDRLEHLMASSSTTDRLGSIGGAFSAEGELIGLRFRNVVDVGAYIRAPEPASIYRMHAASNGSYRVRNIEIENLLVVTNRTPTGLNRGFGGPQFYFALEGLMDKAARRLQIDPAELRRRNFIRKEEFPYDAPAGAVYDSGDYAKALDEALRLADYEALKVRRDRARSEGRLFGIGFAMGVEPSGSNMAYVSLAQTVEQRAKGTPKSGGNGSATIGIDPSGQVTCYLDSTPNGQGHATVAAQIIADQLGVNPDSVDVVTELDTRNSAWSVASGNYSNRFSTIVVEAVSRCASQVADKLKAIAADGLGVDVQAIELVDGAARVRGDAASAIPIRQLAARAHWHPTASVAGLFETATWSPPILGEISDDDRVASALTFGFVCDLAAVEIDRATGSMEIVKYVSVHDVGNVLNQAIVEGQVYGGFANGIGAALFEELAYDAKGNFLSGSFAEYLCPTAPDMPELVIGHVTTPSPTNRLGSKGMGDGSSMSSPAALANAVGDALGRHDIEPPLTLNRIWAYANGVDQEPPRREEAVQPDAGEVFAPQAGGLSGDGEVTLTADPARVWAAINDVEFLKSVIPGCQSMTLVAPDRYQTEVIIGVAGMRGTYHGEVAIHDKQVPGSMRLVISAEGRLGFGTASAWVHLSPAEAGTLLRYQYTAQAGGTVAAVGNRLLGSVMKVLIKQFFKSVEGKLTPKTMSWRVRLRRWVRALVTGGRPS